MRSTLMYLWIKRVYNISSLKISWIFAEEVALIIDGLWRDCSLSSRKANVVADALSRLSMGSVSHIDDDKKIISKDVQRLVIWYIRTLLTIQVPMIWFNIITQSRVRSVPTGTGFENYQPSINQFKLVIAKTFTKKYIKLKGDISVKY